MICRLRPYRTARRRFTAMVSTVFFRPGAGPAMRLIGQLLKIPPLHSLTSRELASIRSIWNPPRHALRQRTPGSWPPQ